MQNDMSLIQKLPKFFVHRSPDNIIGDAYVLSIPAKSDPSLEPEVDVDADDSGSSTNVTPVKAGKVLKGKEKPACKRK